MRVCIFSTAFLPLVGGAEISVYEVARRIKDFEFDMYTARIKPELPRFENFENIRVMRVGVGREMDKKLLALHGAFYAKEGHEKNPYDVNWSIMASYSGFAALAFKKRNPRIPYLLSLQEGDSMEHILKRVWGFTWKYKQIFKEADALHAISTPLLEWGQKMGFGGKFKKVIPNGADIDLFGHTGFEQQASKDAFRKKYGIPANVKLIVTVSRLVEKNGVEYIIHALKEMDESAHLLVVGGGALLGSLEALTKNLGLAARVHFAGTLPQKEVADVLHIAHVFCRPSLTEGFGNAFIEAMAAGAPVVSTNQGGLADFIQDQKNSFVVPPKNSRAIAAALENILNNKALAGSLAAGGRETAKKYSWDIIARDMRDFILSFSV